MELGLQGTVAFVAGASQGLGKAIALGLAQEGCKVALCSRRADELAAVADEIKSRTGSTAVVVAADVTKPEEIKVAIASTVEQLGRLDILVTNGGGPPAGTFVAQSDEAWQKAFELNLMSVVRLIREALPHLQKSGRGRIINMTSSSVKEPVQALILSNALRAGVVGLAKTLSVELASDGITVNNIAPGRIDTARIRYLDKARAQAQGITEEEAKAASITQIPLGRYGMPEEVANMAVFLASDKAAYVTGTTIPVDGGMLKGT
jgi:3-oxoacyl-[acyl-carrier protein] reductase